MRFPFDRKDSDLDREIAHHLHELAAEYQRQGHSREEALRMARRQFGGREQIKEECRDQHRWAWWTGFRQDVVFGLRMMRKTPVVTAAAVLSLALGIGATTAIGSLMDVVLWRSLPLPEPQQLSVVLWRGHGFPRDIADGASGSMFNENGWSVADFFPYTGYRVMRKAAEGKASLAAYAYPDPVSVSFAGRPTVAQERPVSGNFLKTLQVRPIMGRVLADSDDEDAAQATVVLSHRFWRRALDSNPGVIGQTLRIDDRPHVIVGVLEPSFYGLVPGDSTELYTPLHHAAWLRGGMQNMRPLENDRAWCVSLIARRAAGVAESEVRPLLDTVFRSTWTRPVKDQSKVPQIHLDDGSRGLGSVRGEFRSPLLVLGGLVALLLVIACTNIANLLLARATARRKEVAMRISLGCSQARLMRQFLTESALLALLGGVTATAIAYLTANLLGAFMGTRDRIPISVALNVRLLAITAITTVLALLLFGLFPAWRSSRLSVAEAAKEGAGSLGTSSRRGGRNERILVLVQVAMSIVLVMTAVVFTRNLLAVDSLDAGFDRRKLIMFGLRPGVSGYEKSRLPAFYFNLEQRLAATPGVSGVGLASMRPMNVGGWWEDVSLPGEPKAGTAAINGVTPGYLPLFTSRMMAGRGFTVADITGNAKVAVISEDLAVKLGGPSVLGRKLAFEEGPGRPAPTFEIVGITPSMASNSIKERPFAVWVPMEPDRVEATVVLRTSAPPQAVLTAVRQAMEEIDRNLPMVDVITMEEQISKVLQRERMFAILCGGLGLLALILSVVGLYGVTWYSTSRRRAEIGVRLRAGRRPARCPLHGASRRTARGRVRDHCGCSGGLVWRKVPRKGVVQDEAPGTPVARPRRRHSPDRGAHRRGDSSVPRISTASGRSLTP